MPTSSAATSLSRTRRMARPVRLWNRLAIRKNATPAATIETSASHMLVIRRVDVPGLNRSVSHRGGVSADGRLRPKSPPVHDGNA